jgi:hypothetical protein
MAKSSKIEPINIELYEKAWAHSGRGVQTFGESPRSSRTKKKARKRKRKRSDGIDAARYFNNY